MDIPTVWRTIWIEMETYEELSLHFPHLFDEEELMSLESRYDQWKPLFRLSPTADTRQHSDTSYFVPYIDNGERERARARPLYFILSNKPRWTIFPNYYHAMINKYYFSEVAVYTSIDYFQFFQRYRTFHDTQRTTSLRRTLTFLHFIHISLLWW